MRKNFSTKIKITLAQRSGYICSYPTCENLTIGPNDEGKDKTSSVGMACHIYSASNGFNAKRTNKNLTDEQVTDISNGIWMCYTHGKLIDTDDIRFTPEILKEWKNINEQIAKIRQETSFDYKTAYKNIKLENLVKNKIELPKEFGINKLVGDAINDSWLVIAWGEQITATIRDFLIEYIRNAHIHGQANKVSLEISQNEIIVLDDGKDYDPRELYKTPSKQGGSMSIHRLLKKYSSSIFMTSIREGEKNKLTISMPKNRDYIINSTPCVVPINSDVLYKGNIKYTLIESCKEVFFLLPDYFTLSDIAIISINHPLIKNEDRHIIFVISKVSQYVQELLVKQFPNCQVLEV